MTPARSKTTRNYIALCLGLLAILLITCSPLFADTADTVPPEETADTAQPQAAVAPPTVHTTRAPVSINGKVLFYVQSKILSISPETRAEIIAKRLENLVKNPLFDLAAMTVTNAETTTDLTAGDLTIMTVTEDDATAAGKKRLELANDYAASIRSAIDTQKREYSLQAVLFGILFTVLATIVFILLMVFIKKIFLRAYAQITLWQDVRIHGLKFQKLQILSASQVTNGVLKTAKLMRAALVILLLYFYLPLVLSFFPWTRSYSSTIFGYILSPLITIGKAFFSYLPNLFFLFAIIFVTYYGLKLVKMVFNALGKTMISIPGFYAEWAQPTYKIVRFIIIAFAAVVAFPYLPGAESPAFKGISVFLGVLFSFGSAGAISNIVAGIILTYMRAFTLGDRVKIADTIGDVVEKTLLVTRIRTIKNEDITIPNSMVLGSHIINYSSSAKERGLILHTTITIGYDVPWKQVHELLIAAALSSEHILKEPAPFVLQTSLDDFYVSYQLNAYTDQPNKMAIIYAGLHQNIQDKFNEAGVEIMSPHYSTLRDGNQTTIPEKYLGNDYAPPGFKIAGLDGLFKGAGK